MQDESYQGGRHGPSSLTSKDKLIWRVTSVMKPAQHVDAVSVGAFNVTILR